MLENLLRMSDSEIRSICKDRIESLEHWLRRLIDDMLSPPYGDYFTHVDSHGNRLIRKSLSDQIDQRRRSEPGRYPRKIDAVLLDDSIAIICNDQLFGLHFRAPLSQAFPEGREEARTFLQRLVAPRNQLAHANAISLRQAEQVVCYSNDVIDSLKAFYIGAGMQSEYNVPLILRVTDSFGSTYMRSQFQANPGGGILKGMYDEPRFYLRPGDTLTVEVEVDPAFDPGTYELQWSASSGLPLDIVDRPKIAVAITRRHVAEQFYLFCRLATKREWHRLPGGLDDQLVIAYKVLPPIE